MSNHSSDRATRLLALTRAAINALREVAERDGRDSRSVALAVRDLTRHYIERERGAPGSQTIESIITVYGSLMFQEMVVGVTPEQMLQPAVTDFLEALRPRGGERGGP